MIDVEQVRKVAHLARLQLEPATDEQFATQLSSILEYFEQLQELDTSNVTPTTRAIEINNVTRPDELEPLSQREAILAEAPSRDDDFFRVPQILSSE
ncbi:MAG: Asp-tRNA(Asn)/Glu-tRNA(Gln) amidotransferase subunit GatC [Prochloron sp. SP5CPC1]|nr:Asp-tRNA(Asn)/Glu-tRNA(Gln) amidotransferase subunit GatC [Candidatus Paraprochloron terpiosi SP5CPC1]